MSIPSNGSNIPSFVSPKHPDAPEHPSQDHLVDPEKGAMHSFHHHHKHPKHMHHHPTQHSGAHEFGCLKCLEHGQMTAFPAPPEAKEPVNVYLEPEKKTLRDPNKIGKIFNPVRSKERDPGFGMKLWGSTFGKSLSSSSTSKSFWAKSFHSGDREETPSAFDGVTRDPTDRMYEHYEEIAMQSSNRGEFQSQEAGTIPHNASYWTRDQYARTTLNSPPRPRQLSQFPPFRQHIEEQRTVQIPHPDQSSRPIQSPQSIISPISASTAQSQRPLLSTVNYLKPLPPTPSERKESNRYSKQKTRNIFNPKTNKAKEGGLPLDLFTTRTSSDDADTRKSWL
jgi:hypothetical protein